ncbi:MAG: sugar O-acyltransferase [Clostridia bacterium]|nr:sugar O-acyltransferase [Clostridia bacterium]
MKDIIIVCAGNCALEMYYVIKQINMAAQNAGKEPAWNVLGFLSDVPVDLKAVGIEVPVLGTIQDWHPIGNEYYGMGNGTPQAKEKLANLLRPRGCRFASIIAPYTFISDDFVCGEGCLIQAYRIGCCVKLGDFVSINGSMLMSGAQIDDYTTTTGYTVVQSANVGKRVYIGSHAVVTDGVTVGDDAMISVGSIVTEDVRPKATVFGVPAKEI